MVVFRGYPKQLLHLAIFALSIIPSNAQNIIDPEIKAKIDSYVLETFLPSANITGMGLAIVQNNGEVLYTTGYGPANVEKNIPIENFSKFGIASITKSFTSIVIAKTLHEKFPEMGEAVLGTPISKLIPQANFTLIDRFRTEYTSFRDLVSHRMCLAGADMILVADPIETAAEVVYRTRYNKEMCGFRSEFQYNNPNYQVAAEMIAIVANKPYEELVGELLAAIGMVNTSFIHRSDDISGPEFAQPYYFKDGEMHPFNLSLVSRIVSTNACGGLISTPNDMTRYMRLHLNLGNIDGNQVVPKEVMEWVRKPVNFFPMNSFKGSEEQKVFNQFAYGMGLWMSSYDGWEAFEHSGGWAPFMSEMSFYPEQNLGIFSTTNMGQIETFSHYVPLHGFIFDAITGNGNAEKQNRLVEQMKTKNEKSRKETREKMMQFKKEMSGKKVPANIVGKYGNGAFGDLEITERLNPETNEIEYFIEYGRWIQGWLRQVEEDGPLFKIHYVTDIFQDDLAYGAEESGYAAFFEDSLKLILGPESQIDFKLGESLDTLPVIPWAPESCGP